MKDERISIPQRVLMSLLLFALIIVITPVQCKLNSNSAEAATSSEERQLAAVPIVMYHRISKHASANDRFEISPAQLENDLNYLKNSGYEAIVMKDLTEYVCYGNPLPEKPVMLTFDDGNYSDYKYVYPLLKKYSMKAVLSIIGKPVDKYSDEAREDINYPNLVWDQINTMLNDGVVEIQSHSYDLHGKNGSGKLRYEEKEQYQARLKQDLEKMQLRVKEKTGIAPTVFTYPFGLVSKDSFEVLREVGFIGSFTCYEGVNTILPGKPESLFLLKRYNRTANRPIQKILAECRL